MSDVLDADLKLNDLPEDSDEPFVSGMETDGPDLHDPAAAYAQGTPFGGRHIDGVLIVAGSDDVIVKATLDGVMAMLGFNTEFKFTTFVVISQEKGRVLEGASEGHEQYAISATAGGAQSLTVSHSFGFEDGISQPILRGINDKTADPKLPFSIVDKKNILVGYEKPVPRSQTWMKNGSFLCFRKLQQDVKAWDDAVTSIADKAKADPKLVGAKLMGRWPSGM